MHRPLLLAIAALMPLLSTPARAGKYDVDALPKTKDGFAVRIVAREPDLVHPAALAFDAHGRLFVGGGPQFRDPSRDTPPDRIKVVHDADRDGKADDITLFAKGFNAIQALAWKGGDLWVANAPDVTVVRDTDGDLRADEYVRVFKGLGHLRHGLHGFNWAPDGRLYMSQGNSRVQKNAPRAFRRLMGVDSDAPGRQPINKVYAPEDYEPTYIGSWPSAEGGILRCRNMGRGLEIYSRGNRNPWDMAFDSGFNWLATDNDPGPNHDRMFMPFDGAHFGYRHPWSFSWTGEDNPATAPASGLFPTAAGSGVGVVYYTADQFPEKYQNVFYIGDWTNNCVYTFRPKWDGALMRGKGELTKLASAGPTRAGTLGFQGGEGRSIFRPTDIAVGPTGAMYVAGWGPHYGSKHAPYRDGDAEAERNYGRIFRIWHEERPLKKREAWHPDRRDTPYREWSFDQLLADLDAQVRVWRVNAQDEIVRRGREHVADLVRVLRAGELSKMQETWAAWALGRIGAAEDRFRTWAAGGDGAGMNLRIQSIRILGDLLGTGAGVVAEQLAASEPRVRFAAALSLRRMGATSVTEALVDAAAKEEDRLCFYADWQALRSLLPERRLRTLLNGDRPGVRRAALLALLEDGKLKQTRVASLAVDSAERVASVARQWLEKTSAGPVRQVKVTPSKRAFPGTLEVTLRSALTEAEGVRIRYTLDGDEPTASAKAFDQPLTLDADRILKAAVFRDGDRVGPVRSVRFNHISEEEWSTQLFVRDLKVDSDRTYRVLRHGMRKGAELYTDRDYTYTKVPELARGATYIRTANDDSGSGGDAFLRFRINLAATVYVAHDERADDKPDWLQTFERTDHVLETTDVPFRLFRKRYPAGEVVLGGNGSGAPSMYQVLLAKASASDVRPTVAKAKAALDGADPARGEKIFFGRGACFTCHKVGGRGNAVGPDLSDVGRRTKATYIIESIIRPSAAITEGYQAATVKTTDGRQIFGLVREETGEKLTLHRTDGRSVTVPKEKVADRKTLDQSAMPPTFARLLGAQEIADVTAWLLKQRAKPTDGAAEEAP